MESDTLRRRILAYVSRVRGATPTRVAAHLGCSRSYAQAVMQTPVYLLAVGAQGQEEEQAAERYIRGECVRIRSTWTEDHRLLSQTGLTAEQRLEANRWKPPQIADSVLLGSAAGLE